MEGALNYHPLELDNSEEDALSLCDLPIHDQQEQDSSSPRHQYLCSPSRHDLFEFSTDLNREYSGFSGSEIVFCGKILNAGEPPEYESGSRRALSSWRSESLARNQSRRSDFVESRSTNIKRSNSVQFIGSSYASPLYKEIEIKKRQKVLIGLARVPASMDLSEIRKRQSRRVPAPMFPVVAGERTGVSDDRNMRRDHWRLFKSLRYRSILVSALAKASHSCIPRMSEIVMV